MRAINTEVDQHQLPLGEGALNVSQIVIIQAGQHTVPDVGSPQVVAIAAAFQIAEQIHGPSPYETMEGIGGNRDVHRLASLSSIELLLRGMERAAVFGQVT